MYITVLHIQLFELDKLNLKNLSYSNRQIAQNNKKALWRTFKFSSMPILVQTFNFNRIKQQIHFVSNTYVFKP